MAESERPLDLIPETKLLDTIIAMDLSSQEELELLEKYRHKIGEDALLRMMELYSMLGKNGDLERIGEELNTAPALYLLGRVANDSKKAERYYRRSLEISYEHRTIDALSNLLLSSGEVEEAVEILNIAIQKNDEPSYFKKLVWGYYLMKKLDYSKKYLDIFRELCTERGDLAHHGVLKALIKITEDKSTEAVTTLQEVSHLRIEDTEPTSNALFYLVLAKLYKMGEIPSYELDYHTCLNRALSIARQNEDHMIKALVHLEKKQIEEAKKIIGSKSVSKYLEEIN